MINVPCKRHFAQAKDIERFLQDQPDFLETGNGGRPALKEAKTTDESNNNMIICVLLRFLISFALSVLMSFRVEASPNSGSIWLARLQWSLPKSLRN